jgi:Mg2+ and Co2+ transporter CorA
MCSGELLERVRYAGSKLRLNDARYLLHALIDSSVEAVFPIISLYRQQLGAMSRKLHSYVQHQDPRPNAQC